MLTQANLRKWLDYNPSNGIFRWKVSRAYTVKVGQIAGAKGPKGSWRIEVARKNYLAHRLAWFYVHGVWPEQIDHINGDRGDNRLCNLRAATNGQNQANYGAKSNSALGIRGVGFRRGWYVVQLKSKEKNIRIYQKFKTIKEAKLFAKETSIKLHGEFSIHNREVSL